MRGAATSDLHLGFRAFPASYGGRNLRERDVERAWFELVDQVVEADVDLFSIAGDIFHHPRVSDHARFAFLSGLRTILRESQAHILIEPGNHDAGKTADVLTPVALGGLLDAHRVWVATTPERLRITVRGGTVVAAACFPYVARGQTETYRLEPDQGADVNLLLVHAAVKSSTEGAEELPHFYGSDDQALDVGYEADRWDVIHLGDYHEFRRLHPDRLVFYPGAIERTSNNIWIETEPKGWVLYDTDARSLEFRTLQSPRHTVALEIEGAGTAGGVNNVVSELLEQHWTKGSIVRLMVSDFPRQERETIDWRAMKALQNRCAHFQLDIRYSRPEQSDLGDRRAAPGRTVEQQARAYFANSPPEVRAIVFEHLGMEAA